MIRRSTISQDYLKLSMAKPLSQCPSQKFSRSEQAVEQGSATSGNEIEPETEPRCETYPLGEVLCQIEKAIRLVMRKS